MSRAFVREGEGDPEPLPERVVSPHPNLVTPRGLSLIESQVRDLEAARAAGKSARRAGGAAADAAALASIERDLRYWLQRQASARVVEPVPDPDVVRFGVTVTLSDERGSERTLQIVGEDEAAPAQGFISWVSPLAAALMGAEEGEEIAFGEARYTIERLA